MNGLNKWISGKRTEKRSNITKYPVGTRVPRNEKAERIVREVIIKNSTLTKTKRSI